MIVRKPVYVLLVVALLCAFAKGQVQNTNTFEVRANLMVLSDKNEIVDDIKQSDVKIFENGVEQKIAYFAAKERPLSVALVVDNTGSMREKVEQEEKLGKIVVANLRTGDQVELVRFVDRKNITVLQAWSDDAKKLNDLLENLFVEGGQSAIIDGLYLAGQDILKRHSTADKRRYAMILISDGEERDSFYNQKQLFELLHGSDVQIFPIGLLGGDIVQSNSRTRQFLTKLAGETGGTAFVFDKKSTTQDMINAMKSLITELRSPLVVGYLAKDVRKETATRKLTAVIADGPKGEKRTAVIKDSIVLPVD